ncbi:MAG: damage-inducible protein DinB [Ignavibacteriae bacterium]|nr:MAG: damage-inducible protein DinB [Ignavibacteriota bacterium]
MTPHEIQQLYDYDQWADLKLLEAIGMVARGQYQKDMVSSFGGIHGTLVHILSADKIWFARWTKNPPVPLKVDDFPTVEVVKKQWDAYHCEMSNFVRSLTDEKLNEPLEYTDFKGDSYSHPLCLQMQHKVNHSSYHRGQVITMLRQLGEKVVSTDMINYIRQKESRG